MPKHFLSITDFSEKEILLILKKAIALKKSKRANTLLKNKTLVMIFEKPSLRTRISFEIGMTQFGGHAIYLGPSDISLGKRESVSDIAKVTSSMADIIMARTFSHQSVTELAQHASVPVINGLSDMEHPCQILADFQTILEKKGKLKGLTLSFVGDCENNIVHSLALGSAIFGMNFQCAAPKGYTMNKEVVKKAKQIAAKTGVTISENETPQQAVKNADVVITDKMYLTWGNVKAAVIADARSQSGHPAKSRSREAR